MCYYIDIIRSQFVWFDGAYVCPFRYDTACAYAFDLMLMLMMFKYMSVHMYVVVIIGNIIVYD